MVRIALIPHQHEQNADGEVCHELPGSLLDFAHPTGLALSLCESARVGGGLIFIE